MTKSSDLRIEQALSKCRDQFEFYVTAHLAKSPPDMDKAATNKEFVEMCDDVLARFECDHLTTRGQVREALEAAHETLHKCTAVLSATDCADVVATMSLIRGSLASPEETVLAGVKETVKECALEGVGFWTSCPGCHERSDGQDVRSFPFSEAFGCVLGGGCRECGGIGAIWDMTDYAEMAREMLADDAALSTPDTGDGWQDISTALIGGRIYYTGSSNHGCDVHIEFPGGDRHGDAKRLEKALKAAQQSTAPTSKGSGQ